MKMERIDYIIIKYLTRTASPGERNKLLAWLEESEENKKYFRGFKDVYDLGSLENHLKESRTEEQWRRFKRETVAGRTARMPTTGYAILRYVAVFLLGCFALQTVWYFTRPEKEEIARTLIETGVGDRTTLTLPDGSKVWINSCSSVSYDNTYGVADRKIELQGEAFFDVNSDTLTPFLVRADKFLYRVTGTSFNVYSFAGENEVSIALLEGGVIIEYDERHERLYPGEVFVFNKKTGESIRKKKDVDRLAFWRKGEAVFDNMTFEELSKRLERRFGVVFRFENEQIKTESFSGSFYHHESLETVLKVISTSVPVRYTIEEGIVYIK